MPLRGGKRSTGETQIVVIGTGNPYRNDDAVGVVFSRRIRQSAPKGVTVVEHDGEPANLMEAWDGADVAYVVDAVHTVAQMPSPPGGETLAKGKAGNAGRIYRFEAHREPIAAELFRVSTHAFGVAEAIELARTLGRLPPSLIVYGIGGDNFDHGGELSPEVDAACDEVVFLVLEEIRDRIHDAD